MSHNSDMNVKYWDEDDRSLSKLSCTSNNNDDIPHIPITDILKQYYDDINPHMLYGIEIEKQQTTNKKCNFKFLQKEINVSHPIMLTENENDVCEYFDSMGSMEHIELTEPTETIDSFYYNSDDEFEENNSNILDYMTYKHQWYS